MSRLSDIVLMPLASLPNRTTPKSGTLSGRFEQRASQKGDKATTASFCTGGQAGELRTQVSPARVKAFAIRRLAGAVQAPRNDSRRSTIPDAQAPAGLDVFRGGGGSASARQRHAYTRPRVWPGANPAFFPPNCERAGRIRVLPILSVTAALDET